MCPEQLDQYNKFVTISDSFFNEVYSWVNVNRDMLEMATVDQLLTQLGIFSAMVKNLKLRIYIDFDKGHTITG